MRQKLFSVIFIFALVIGTTAHTKRRAEKGAPRIESIRTHVSYLASDKLDGRRTGTEGATLAANYIAKEFVKYGLRPGLTPADKSNPFLQSFPYVAGVELGKTNAISLTRRAPAIVGEPVGGGITTTDFSVTEEWLPLGFSTNERLYMQAVAFVGYGITVSDMKYDDYSGSDVKDRVALAFEGTPDRDNPHGEFARFADVRWKAVAARDHGAKALIVIASEEKFNDDSLSKLSYDNSAGDAGLPVIVISRQAAAKILGLGGVAQLAELEKRLASAALARKDSTQPTYPVIDAVNKASFMEQSRVTLSVNIVRRDAKAFNVIGTLEGSDPKLKKEVIVIGAHYDHLGRGGASSLAPRSGEIHHGADDNASGVAGVLELAHMFSRKDMRPKRTLVFIAFSGEEEGLLGSNYYVNHPVAPLTQTVAMINMDMIGRLNDDKLIIGGVGTSSEWREWIVIANSDLRNPEKIGDFKTVSVSGPQKFSLTLNEDGYGPSDHSSFYSKQVPVLFFWTGTHEDYHKPTDTADKINYEGEVRILSLVYDVVFKIDRTDQRPVYAVAKSESAGRTMGFKVSLGTIPNYAESTDGLKLDGVRDDSPASKAGLKAGDVIVKLAGRDIKNVYDYTYALGEMKAGQEYEVELIRGTERLKFTIIPAARK